MPEQQQISVPQVTAAPSNYTLAPNVELILKAVNADFTHNGAAVDWLPAVVLISDSGHVIARAVDRNVKVTAGDDAEVSWFPGVKNAGAAITSAVQGQALVSQARTAVQAIPSGAVTVLAPDVFTQAPSWVAIFNTAVLPSGTLTFVNSAAVFMELVVDFPAAAYDRYIELTTANASLAEFTKSPRVRQSVTPDGDRLSVSGYVFGNAGPPATTITANVFQASGVNRNVTGMFQVYQLNGIIRLA